MHEYDNNAILWDHSGLTFAGLGFISNCNFMQNGQSGGSCAPFTAVSETFLFGIRLGWWAGRPSYYVVWEPFTVRFAAEQYICDANYN